MTATSSSSAPQLFGCRPFASLRVGYRAARSVVALTTMLLVLVAGSLVFAAETASAQVADQTGTRVAATNPNPGTLVEADGQVSPGGVGSDPLLFDDTASGCCVAPRSVGGAADDLGALCRTNSFVPATLVLMADGTTTPIADVRVGDMVIATDPETGERGPRRVTDTIIGDGLKELVDIEIDGNVITATDRHPFWVDDEGRWVDAEDLEAGDVLLVVDGDTATVDSVRGRTEVRRVHNLTVDGIHTYYVLAGDDPVLVHNCAQGAVRAVDDAVPDGPTFIGFADSPPMVVPTRATGPTRPFGPGMQFTGGAGRPGFDIRVTGVRVMDATAHHARRTMYMNAAGQTVNPFTGRTVLRNDPWAHLPW